MQATGIEKELGGEAPAIAALQAVGDAYERRLRGVEAQVPKMVPAAFTGEGMGSGLVGMGIGGFTGMMTGSAISSMSDAQVAEMTKAGPIKFGGKDGEATLQFGEDGAFEQSMTFEVNENGLNGKVRVKSRMESCPDPEGKVTVELEVDSQMSVSGKPGTGGHVHSRFTYERYLDDDAHLINTADGSASNMRIQMSGAENFQNQSLDLTVGYERDGNRIWEHHDESGYSIFRPEEVERTKKLLEAAEFLNTLIAEAMLRGMGAKATPWESGRCIRLEVTSDPGRRKGIRPNTAFDIEAKPRVKSDGTAAGGTVTATLSGGSSLQPASGKVPADAKYGYAGPGKEKEKAQIDFESRSKRGVGRATLEFDTSRGGYRMVGGKCPEAVTVCDITKPFTRTACGATMTHVPTSDKGGTYTFEFKGGGGVVRSTGSGTYTLSGTEDQLLATHSSHPICASAGMTKCYTHPPVTATWTRIEDCRE